MKMRRKGLIVVLISDNEKDDKRLRHFATRYNRSLSAGFGHKRIVFELPDDYKILYKILVGVWGKNEGERLSQQLARVITRLYINGDEKEK